jgi:hypothetical protein
VRRRCKENGTKIALFRTLPTAHSGQESVCDTPPSRGSALDNHFKNHFLLQDLFLQRLISHNLSALLSLVSKSLFAKFMLFSAPDAPCFIRGFGNEVRQLSTLKVKLAPQMVWTKQARLRSLVDPYEPNKLSLYFQGHFANNDY